jgi:hypothetical protein
MQEAQKVLVQCYGPNCTEKIQPSEALVYKEEPHCSPGCVKRSKDEDRRTAELRLWNQQSLGNELSAGFNGY